MSRLFRRALSTTVSSFAAGPSSAPTLPLAVRRRREEHPATYQPSALVEPEKFVGEGAEPFPVQMEQEFQTLRARGDLVGDEDEARRKFLAANQAWRSRVRGGHGVIDPETGKVSTEKKLDFLAREAAGVKKEFVGDDLANAAVVGQKIYLPNLQIRLMRNHTPPGEPYDPWVATFRLPPSVTKNDLRSYLYAVYGLEVTFIRTDNYQAPLTRGPGGQIRREAGSKKNYKRAVVGLKEPFHYPDDIEEMRAGTWGGLEAGAEQAAAREELIESEYAIQQVKDFRDSLKTKSYKRTHRWRTDTHDNKVSTPVGEPKAKPAEENGGRGQGFSAACHDVLDRSRQHVLLLPPSSPLPFIVLVTNKHRATPSARSCAAARSARPRSPSTRARCMAPPRSNRQRTRLCVGTRQATTSLWVSGIVHLRIQHVRMAGNRHQA